MYHSSHSRHGPIHAGFAKDSRVRTADLSGGGAPLTAVFSAGETATDSDCAVKVLRAKWEDETPPSSCSEREARAGLSVRHPHLVRSVRPRYPAAVLSGDGAAAGESLRRRLRRDYRLDVPAALWVAARRPRRLAALHRAGFLHGDVKPDNIRLVDDGTAVLIDLGFAHRPGENAASAQRATCWARPTTSPRSCAPSEPAERRPAQRPVQPGRDALRDAHRPTALPARLAGQTFRRHRSDPPADVRLHDRALPAALVSPAQRLLVVRAGGPAAPGCGREHSPRWKPRPCMQAIGVVSERGEQGVRRQPAAARDPSPADPQIPYSGAYLSRR